MLEKDAPAPTMWRREQALVQENARLKELVVRLSKLSVNNVMSPGQAADSPYLPRYCHPDECAHCSLADQPNQAPCLRRKAQLCMKLATILFFEDRAALERVSVHLMDRAHVIDREFSRRLPSY